MNNQFEDFLSMTHRAEPSNPAQPILDFAKRFSGGGLQRALGLPNNIVGRSVQNPDNLIAIPGVGMAIPKGLEKLIRQAMESGSSISEIASLAKKYALPNKASVDLAKMKSLIDQGLTYEKLGSELGISRAQAHRIAKEMNYQKRDNRLSTKLQPSNDPLLDRLKSAERDPDTVDLKSLQEYLKAFSHKE